MFNGLEHTAIASPDPGRLAGWYRDTLEFAITFVYDGNYFVRGRNGSLLEIVPALGERGPQTRTDPGIRHLAIDVDEFDAACERLKSAGVTFLTEPFENQGNRLVFFEDLDGNILHLISRPQPLP